MKKNYLFLLVGLIFCLQSRATIYYSRGGNVSILTNWNSSITGGGGLTPTGFCGLSDTFKIRSGFGMTILADSTWTVCGVLWVEDVNLTMVKYPGSGNTATLNVGKALVMSGVGRIATSPAFTDVHLQINLDGNLWVNGFGNFFINPISTTHSIDFHFNDVTASELSPRTISWTSTALSRGATFSVDNGSHRRLISDWPLPDTTMGHIVKGALDFGVFKTTGNSSNAFTIDDGAHVYMKHAAGIDYAVQGLLTKSFSQKANYHYDGSVAQVTGNTLPAAFLGAGSITINNTVGDVTLSQVTTFDVGSSVNLDKGIFDNGSLLTMLTGSQVNVDAGNFGANPIYNALVDVTYTGIGLDTTTSMTTGNELLPVALTTSIGNLRVNKFNSAGTSHTVILGSDVSVNGDVLLDRGVLDANAGSPFTINAKGGWYNNSPEGGYMHEYDGWVRFNGTALQSIGGSEKTKFYHLEVNNPAGLVLKRDEKVEGELALDNGALDVDVHNLEISVFAAITTTTSFSSTTKLIAANATGRVKRTEIYGADNFFFPIGDTIGYSPLTINFDAASIGTFDPWLGVNVAPLKHYANANNDNYLNRYWRIATNDVSVPIYSVTATYETADVQGSEANLSAGQYTGSLPWIKYGPANTSTNTLMFDGPILDNSTEITGITTTAPTVSAPADRRICDSATQTTTLTATASTSLDLPLSYQWSPAIDLSTTGGLVTTITPTSTFVRTYTITVTDGNGFTGYATTTVTVDPAPKLGSGAGPEVSVFGSFVADATCIGTDLYLLSNLDNVASYQWSGPVTIDYGSTASSAQVASVTPSAAGVYTLTVNNGTSPGCRAMYMTNTVTVNPLPAAPIVTAEGGGFVFCKEATLNATPTTDIYYQGTTVDGHSLLAPTATVTVGVGAATYYFRVQDANFCWGPDAGISVTVNPMPVQYYMTLPDGDTYCENGTGVRIGMENTELGIRYYLYDPADNIVDSLDGTGVAEEFGLFTEPGNYEVYGRNIVTGCIERMYQLNGGGFATVVVRALPERYDLTGGKGYCISGPNSGGRPVGIANTESGVFYQLYYRDNSVGALFNPIGLPLYGISSYPMDFTGGPFTGEGVYMVIATTDDVYACTDTMSTMDSIWINPLPNVYSIVTPDSAVCIGYPGPTIRLGNSDGSTSYDLFLSGNSTYLQRSTNLTGGIVNFGSFPSTTDPAGVYVYTISATDTNQCSADMLGSVTVTVNPAPMEFTMSSAGNHPFCTGIPITVAMGLVASEAGIRYDLYQSGILAVSVVGDGVTPIDFGSYSTAGNYEVTAVNTTTGCVTGYVYPNSTQIVENVLPNIDTMKGGGHYCDGVPPGVPVSNTGIANILNPNVQYLLYNNGDYLGIFTSGSFGDQMLPGWYTAIARDMSTGCESPVYDSVAVVIDSLPHIHSVVGGGEYCVNDTTARAMGLNGSQIGIEYKLYRDVTTLVDSFVGTGTALGFGSTVITGNYTVIATNEVTGCVSNMFSSASIIAQPIPLPYDVIGGGRYCEGSGGPVVDLAGSESADILYQLHRNGVIWGSPVIGTGSSISFGVQDSGGVYIVKAMNTVTGCRNDMDSFAYVVVKPIPVQFTVAGAGPYCAGDTGRHVYLSGSLVGTSYQLYLGAAAIGTPMPGTGFGLDFGLQSAVGTYTVVAELDADSCQRNMIGAVTMYINSLPPVYTVSGGGTICSDSTGASILLSYSDPGVRYQLYRGTTAIGAGIDGTGSGITFAPYNVAGTYSIVGTDLATACASSMTGAATVSVNPLPKIYNVTGGGDYCDGDGGLVIGLDSSETGLIYQLYTGGIPVGAPALGLGTSLNFGLIIPAGTYYAKAINTATGCKSDMGDSATIVINSLPDSFIVTGGGSYCQGGAGVPIFLGGSDPGVDYQLYAGSVSAGVARPGTGTVIHFGPQPLDSTYTVVARDTTTGCIRLMPGNASVTIIPFTAHTVTLNATPGTVIAVGQMDTVVASVSGGGTSAPTYAWRINRNPVPGANTNTLVFMMYFDNDTIECDVTSTGECAGITTTKQIIIHLKPVGVKELASLNGNIRLLPNPNKGMFNLKGNMGTTTDEELDVEVTNMLGQVVYRSKLITKNGDVDEQIQLNSNLANGMYLLNLRSEHASGVFHFVVEH